MARLRIQSPDDMHQMQRPPALDQFIDDGFQKIAAAFGCWLMQKFSKKLFIFSRKNFHAALQAIARGQRTDQLELVAKGKQGKFAYLLWIGERLLKRLNHFRWIEEQGEKFLELLWRHLVRKQSFGQGAEGAGGVVDHVAQFFVFTVDVADDVDGAFGKCKDRRQPRDLRHRRIDVGKQFCQRAKGRHKRLAGIIHDVLVDRQIRPFISRRGEDTII